MISLEIINLILLFLLHIDTIYMVFYVKGRRYYCEGGINR